VLVISRDLRINSVNRNFLEKSKRTEEETLDRRLQEVFPSSILDDMDIARRIQKVFELNEPTTGEKMTYRAPGGLMRIYYYRVLPLAGYGVVESAILLMEDVTEQTRLSEDIRLMERHLAIVVESTSEIILSTDSGGRILSWNKSAEQISNYAPREAAQRFFFQFCAPEHQADIQRTFSELKKGKTAQPAEWNLVTKNGQLVPISWTCSPMLDEQAQTIGIVAVGRDLTESRKLEAQLLQAQKLAALGVMAGGIAHELRNPLAICSSAAQFLMEEDLTPEFRRECAQKICAGIHRSSAIIENLLKFARPSDKSDFSALNLIAVLAETMELIAEQIQRQKVALTVHFPEKPVPVRGNASMLQQVFVNLCQNALNAMPDGGQLNLAVETSHKEVCVYVSDTGHGIAKADINNIFDPFYAKSRQGKGIGLGLPLSYAIVKQHAGSIAVESAEGKGTTLSIKLPLATDE
jgi:PAS domain S-box-containing protein